MKKMIAGMMLLAGGLIAAPRFGVGIGIGTRAPVAAAPPAYYGQAYTAGNGYYAPDGVWMEGYAAPPVRFARRYEHRDRGRNRRFERDGHFDRHDFRR